MFNEIELQPWHRGNDDHGLWDQRDLHDELYDLLARPGGESRVRAELEPELGSGLDLSDPRLFAAAADLLERGHLVLETRPRPSLSVDPHVPAGDGMEDLGNLVDLAEGPPELPTEAPDHWIEIRLVDEAEQPIANERYSIALPDGKSQDGRTDGHGIVRIDPIYKAGHCRISFPDLVDDLADDLAQAA